MSSRWKPTMVITIHITSDMRWFNIRDAASMRCRRRCSPISNDSPPTRRDRWRHQLDGAATLRVATRRTTRRITKPLTRVRIEPAEHEHGDDQRPRHRGTVDRRVAGDRHDMSWDGGEREHHVQCAAPAPNMTIT